MFKTPILMLKMTFFWLLFRGKFEQKTQKSISFKNQWRLKNIKKAMVVKNIIAEDMPFTKSIFEQFWRSYCKKTIFVVFHFLKFLPIFPNERKYFWSRDVACLLAVRPSLDCSVSSVSASQSADDNCSNDRSEVSNISFQWLQFSFGLPKMPLPRNSLRSDT